MRTSFFIAFRYFRAMKRQNFLPLLTIVSIAGVALGTFALISVLSIMSGFNHELEKKLMGFNDHITLTSKSEELKSLTKEDLIKIIKNANFEIYPYIEGEAIAEVDLFNKITALGVKIRGIDKTNLGRLKKVDFYFPENTEKSLYPELIAGNEILNQLSIHPDFADKVLLTAPLADIGPTGELMPVRRQYTLAGSFKSGIYEYDSKYVFLELNEALKLLGHQAQKGYYLTLEDPYKSAKIRDLLVGKLGKDWIIESWDRHNKKLFAALKLERLAMSVILLFIVLIASFSIIGVIMMVVSGKRKDIAILRSIGMSTHAIKKIFLIYGAYIGLIGSIIGACFASGLCFFLMKKPIHLPSSYYLNILPVDWSIKWTVIFMLTGIAITILAVIYPVNQSVKEEIVDRLRYE